MGGVGWGWDKGFGISTLGRKTMSAEVQLNSERVKETPNSYQGCGMPRRTEGVQGECVSKAVSTLGLVRPMYARVRGDCGTRAI